MKESLRIPTEIAGTASEFLLAPKPPTLRQLAEIIASVMDYARSHDDEPELLQEAQISLNGRKVTIGVGFGAAGGHPNVRQMAFFHSDQTGSVEINELGRPNRPARVAAYKPDYDRDILGRPVTLLPHQRKIVLKAIAFGQITQVA